MPLTAAFLRVLRGVLLLVALLVGAYTLATAWNLVSDYTRTLESAKNDARNLAAALDENAANTFGETSRTLLSLAETVQYDRSGQLDLARARAALYARIKRTRYLAGLAIYGAKGEVLASTNAAATRTGIADRADFAFHAETPMPQIYIVAPGVQAQRRLIRVSTRLPAADGSFAGVIEAQVDPEYFNIFYTSINVGAGGRIYLLRQDGTPLVEVPDVGHLPVLLSSSALLRERLRTTLADTIVDDAGILAYRRLAKLPLVAMVSLSRDEVIAPWRERVLKQGVGAVAVLALVAILVWVVWRQISHLGAQDKALQTLVEKRTAELQQRNAELRLAYDALEAVSITDQLTGLKNRRYLLQHLDADVALSLRRYNDRLNGATASTEGADLAFFLIDIDHFKSVNDTYGHAVGDLTLIEISRRLEQVFRDSDFLVRWGGEEFLAVARGTDRSNVEAIAAKVREEVAGRPFELADGLSLPITCSIGAACFPFGPAWPDMVTWAEVVQLADRALYIAKRDGRNRWVAIFADAFTRPERVERYLASADADPAAAGIQVVTGGGASAAVRKGAMSA